MQATLVKVVSLPLLNENPLKANRRVLQVRISRLSLSLMLLFMFHCFASQTEGLGVPPGQWLVLAMRLEEPVALMEQAAQLPLKRNLQRALLGEVCRANVVSKLREKII